MEMADYWILEKDLVPKLFQVLVPRYQDKIGPYTLVHKLPVEYPGKGTKRICMELKGNSLPPIRTPETYWDFKSSLSNVLIGALRNEYKFKNLSWYFYFYTCFLFHIIKIIYKNRLYFIN